MDRAKCLDIFRRSYRKNEILEENKAIIEEKVRLMREIGVEYNNGREKVRTLKNEVYALIIKYIFNIYI